MDAIKQSSRLSAGSTVPICSQMWISSVSPGIIATRVFENALNTLLTSLESTVRRLLTIFTQLVLSTSHTFMSDSLTKTEPDTVPLSPVITRV